MFTITKVHGCSSLCAGQHRLRTARTPAYWTLFSAAPCTRTCLARAVPQASHETQRPFPISGNFWLWFSHNCRDSCITPEWTSPYGRVAFLARRQGKRKIFLDQDGPETSRHAVLKFVIAFNNPLASNRRSYVARSDLQSGRGHHDTGHRTPWCSLSPK